MRSSCFDLSPPSTCACHRSPSMREYNSICQTTRCSDQPMGASYERLIRLDDMYVHVTHSACFDYLAWNEAWFVALLRSCSSFQWLLGIGSITRLILVERVVAVMSNYKTSPLLRYTGLIESPSNVIYLIVFTKSSCMKIVTLTEMSRNIAIDIK